MIHNTQSPIYSADMLFEFLLRIWSTIVSKIFSDCVLKNAQNDALQNIFAEEGRFDSCRILIPALLF